VKNKYKFKLTPEIIGARVNQPRAIGMLGGTLTADIALTAASRIVTLPVFYTKPKVMRSSFKSAIIVSINQCKIRLYYGAKLIKTYPCAPGQPAYPTPTGDFHVDSKTRNAPWINPGTAWAKGMPAEIPGGPDNPMGDSKIGINYSGVFMHSIPPGEFGSIGTHASHACMRMYPWDNHDLYKRVNLGDPVYIRD
jgi:lipoprotein-anchoring transpeptidase ErfK/SrfK